MKSVIVAGHICLDVIPDLGAIPAGAFEQLFQPGRLLQVGAARFCTGGPVSNVGLALHRLGVPVQLVGKVGADPLGGIVRQLVEAYAAGQEGGGNPGGSSIAQLAVDPTISTSYSLIVSPPGMDRVILHHPGANHSFQPEDVPAARLAEAALLHFGYPPLMRSMYQDGGRNLARLLANARQAGASTALDMCYIDPAAESGGVDWAGLLRTALPQVEMFLPSFEELLWMLRRAQFEALAKQGDLLAQASPQLLHELSTALLEMGARVVLIKLGERGAYLRTAGLAALQGMGRARPGDPAAWSEQELWAPCFQVAVAGTTGAGDATIAGFLAALLRGFDPAAAVTMAVAVGACNVEAPDALSGLRSWAETLGRVQAGWARRPLQIEAPGWHWEAGVQAWQGAPEI